jgi:hypothetical protein
VEQPLLVETLAPRHADLYFGQVEESGDTNLHSATNFEIEVSFIPSPSGRPTPLTVIMADHGDAWISLDHMIIAEGMPRFGPIIGMDSRVQATATQVAGSGQHSHNDPTPTEGTTHGARPFAAATMALPSDGTRTLSDTATNGEKITSSSDADSEGWNASVDGQFKSSGSSILFASADALFTQSGAVQGSVALLARTVHGLTSPGDGVALQWDWASVLPRAPQLPLDAEQLGQALQAVLADIDEMGGVIADTFSEDNRLLWGLAAGGAACLVARHHLQSESTAPSNRRERSPVRRRFHDWLPHRYAPHRLPVAR